MSEKRDVVAAMIRVRRAIEKAREIGGGIGGGAGHTTDAVEKLADVVDGLIAALNAEPGLRIDYLRVDAPAKVTPAAAPRET